MTTNEIKTLIQNTIAGQGSQVDIGGKLADVLNALADAVSGVSETVILQAPIDIISGTMTEQEFFAAFTIDGEPATREKFLALVPETMRIFAKVGTNTCAFNWGTRSDTVFILVFGGYEAAGDIGELLVLEWRSNSNCAIYFYEA